MDFYFVWVGYKTKFLIQGLKILSIKLTKIYITIFPFFLFRHLVYFINFTRCLEYFGRRGGIWQQKNLLFNNFSDVVPNLGMYELQYTKEGIEDTIPHQWDYPHWWKMWLGWKGCQPDGSFPKCSKQLWAQGFGVCWAVFYLVLRQIRWSAHSNQARSRGGKW